MSGLKPNKTYFINAISNDATEKNEGRSGTLEFITPAWGVSEQSASSFRRGTLGGNAVVDDSDGLGRVTMSGATSQSRSGTYTSVPLDSLQMVDWDRAIFDAKIPAGASASLWVRYGSTATPDSAWSAWQRVPANGRITGSSRFIQYRGQMSAPAGVAAPSLWAMGFSHNGEAPPTDFEGR